MTKPDTAVDKALHILEVLDGSQTGKSLTRIAELVELPKTTVHRLLGTLVARGFASKTSWNGYRIGAKLIALGTAAAEKDSLLVTARPILWDLMQECQETVQLGLLMDKQLLFVERVEPENVAVRIGSLPSPLSELHTSAMGKAILAASTPEFVERYLGGDLKRYTEKTITDPEVLEAELLQIRKQGYALSQEERHDGVLAIGAAMLNSEGLPFAAISVAAPMHRVYGDKAEKMAMLVIQATDTLSRVIGKAA